MWKIGIALVIVALVAVNAKDIARYIKISSM